MTLVDELEDIGYKYFPKYTELADEVEDVRYNNLRVDMILFLCRNETWTDNRPFILGFPSFCSDTQVH